MTYFRRLAYKNYTLLKITMVALVIFLLIIVNLLDFIIFKKSWSNIIFDMIFCIILSCGVLQLTFFLIKIKERQLENQIAQLCESYQYIGQINRKIDALLELDIDTLMPKQQRPVHETSSLIFKKLLNLLQAKGGLLHLHKPMDFKIYQDEHKNYEIKNALEILARSGTNDFRHSQGLENQQFFQELGLGPELLKRFDFVIKPIYMHNHDIGIMILFFNKKYEIEQRDLDIIRVFSFYLALNATFKDGNGNKIIT